MAATETIVVDGVTVTLSKTYGARRDYKHRLMALGIATEKGELSQSEMGLRATELAEGFAEESIIDVQGFEFVGSDGASCGYSRDVVGQLPDDVMQQVIATVSGTRREADAPFEHSRPESSTEATP
ncbi:MAG: hypothetical protein BWY85_00347 [Firmicutes bacterium ADurb.Bin506]|jgi:hypothetical protein|nr:MAG: hypothetical protein BWY85_00347 [Firmicutes bacterium ADurb.Bin506]